jgi:hypothetical protein
MRLRFQMNKIPCHLRYENQPPANSRITQTSSAKWFLFPLMEIDIIQEAVEI